MENATMRVEGNKLVIEIDLAGDMGVSSSGKSKGIASSHGNVRVEGRPDVMVGFNVFSPLPKDQRPK